nr:hypothetical protein [uncultured Roseateles sp.]
MRAVLVVVSGLLAGVIAWFPCAVGLAAYRYKLGGAQIRSNNRWVLLGTCSPSSFSVIGRIGFIVAMLVWLCIFFGAMGVPVLVARALGIPETSPFIGYAIYANMLVAAVSFLIGPAIWRRIAL